MSEYSITKLRKLWAISYWEDTTDDAGRPARRRHRFSLGTADRKLAEAQAAREWAKLRRPKVITVDHIWQEYRKDRAAKRIAANMEFSGKAVLPFFGSLEPLDVTTEQCRRYVVKRTKQKRKPGTIWTELNHLQIALSWARKKRIISEEILVERPSKPAPRDRRLTREEGRKLLDSATADHIATAIHLLLGTGARVGAALDLTWDRVDLDRGLITLANPLDTATRKGRATVPIADDLRDRLIKARRNALSDYVVEWAGKKLGSIKRGFAAAVKASGLKNVTPHVLRHTAATWMAEGGAPMSEIAAVLGHTDSRTTERIYAKFRPDHLRNTVSHLDMSGVPLGSAEPEKGGEK